jgi:small subunit ribosomal protein S16
MLKLRLRRMGARNRPYYRIVVSDSRLTARAKVLEELGSYDPVAGPGSFSVNRERAEYWIGRGAAVSTTLRSLLDRPQPAASTPASS